MVLVLQRIHTRKNEAHILYIFFPKYPYTKQRILSFAVNFLLATSSFIYERNNCLLSFFYSLLAHDIRSALEGVGLDPAVGYLHRERPGRPSLALDMMEEFRPYLADRLALTLVNRRQIQPADFVRTEAGGMLLKDKARKEMLVAWQERKREEVMHPFLQERMSVGMLCHMQARLLARYIRGDLDAYPPFTVR